MAVLGQRQTLQSQGSSPVSVKMGKQHHHFMQ